jgi:nicotinamide-nucleotide amidase
VSDTGAAAANGRESPNSAGPVGDDAARSSASGRSDRSILAELLTVGDEILAGDIVDANAAFLGKQCRGFGLVVARSHTVRDRVPEIVSALRTAAASADVVLVSGGLGPTTDDRTSEAVATAADVPWVLDAPAFDRLRAKFAAFGRPMPEANEKQARFPEGADILPNPIGTAEGFAVRLGETLVFCMPGVPRELHKMMREQVMPRVAARFDATPVPRRIYRLLGRGESSVAASVEPVLDAARARSPGLASMFVHYRASMPEVQLIVEGTPGPDGVGATADELASLDDALAEALAPALYGIGPEPLAPRLLAALQRANLWLVTAESCTGGGTAARLAAVPGASRAFVGGIVAYDNRIKHTLLRVDEAMLAEHGAVSEPVARAMAAGAREAMGADLCVAITGIAGPTGGTREKPVGTVHIAVCDANGVDHKRLQLRGDRGTVQRAAELWALKLTWDRLTAHGHTTLILPDAETRRPPAEPSLE